MLPVEVIPSRYRERLRDQRFAADQGRHDQIRRSSSLHTITSSNGLTRHVSGHE